MSFGRKIKIAPSILAADFASFGAERQAYWAWAWAGNMHLTTQSMTFNDLKKNAFQRMVGQKRTVPIGTMRSGSSKSL